MIGLRVKTGAALLLGLVSLSCKKQNSQEMAGDSIIEAGSYISAINSRSDHFEIEDYPSAYCRHLEKIDVRVDVAEELAFACKDGLPTSVFLNYRSAALNQEPGQLNFSMRKVRHDTENDVSEFEMAWAFHVPLRPFEIKSRPLYSFISQNYSSERIVLKSGFQVLPAEAGDSGLLLWSADLFYEIGVKSLSTSSFTNQRKTKYKLYQVMAGNEEMGLGVEYLNDPGNSAFKKATMLNFSFNDGRGYNDGAGGTVVISLVHFILRNQGFSETATSVMQEITQHTATKMYEGLRQ